MTRGEQALLIGASAAFALFAATSNAAALGCTCAPPPPTVTDDRESAEIVFLGVVESDSVEVSNAHPPGEWFARHSVTLKIKKVWKGPRQNSIIVSTGDWYIDCGINFERGVDYLVYGRRAPMTWQRKTEQVLTDWRCGRRNAQGFPADDFAQLGQPSYVAE